MVGSESTCELEKGTYPMKRLLSFFLLFVLFLYSGTTHAQDDGNELECSDHDISTTLDWAVDRLTEAQNADPAAQLEAITEVRSRLETLESKCSGADIERTAYQPAFGIDYTHPEQYLAQGEQSQISDPSVLNALRTENKSIAHLGEIYRWLKTEFTAYSARGRTIGVVTVDQLLDERRLGGCNDHALVYAAVARELDYPTIMVRTSSIAWVERFQAGEQGPHVGHVFAEVYLDDKWVLIDPTNGWYVEDGYDPANPVIPLRQAVASPDQEIYGFHVERKGIDIWSYGIHSPAENTQAMDEFARQLNLAAITYPEYTFQHFPYRRSQ
jgi:hypothetical protein